MGVDHDHLQRVRRLLWALLVFASAASLAGNVTHALMQHSGVESVGPILAAALAPVALLGLTHLLALWSHIRARGGVFWLFLVAIIALATAAFRLSFAALRDLAVTYGYSRLDTALFPLILDGLIAVCTLGLVALTRITASVTQTPQMTQPVTHGVGHRDADSVMQPVTKIASRVTQPTAATQRAPAEPRTAEDPKPPIGRDKIKTRAQRLIDSGRTTADLSTVHAVLRHEATGASSRYIAETVGISASTVQRIVKAAREEEVAAV